MDLGLKGRVALITGAGRGIGREIATTLASEGVRVAVNDIFEDRAESVVTAAKANSGQAIKAAADITEATQVERMVKDVLGEWGQIDILVNNAGIPVPLPGEGEAGDVLPPFFVETGSSEWNRTMNIITYGTILTTRSVLPNMMERHWGRVISIVSDAGRVGEPRQVIYSMAKAGLIGFSKALAKEVARFGITANCVSPGATLTEAVAASIGEDGERRQATMRFYPMARGLDRLGLPSDVAFAVACLASAKADWITGQVLSVSGGYSMVD